MGSINITELIKNINLQWYTKNRFEILCLPIALLIFIIYYSAFKRIFAKKDITKVKNSIFDGLIKGSVSITIGVLLNYFDFIKLTNKKLALALFILVSITLILNLLIHIFIYINSVGTFIAELSKYFIYEIMIIIIILGATANLEIFEALSGIAMICIFSFLEKWIYGKWVSIFVIYNLCKKNISRLFGYFYGKELKSENKIEKADNPIRKEEQLFPSRKMQLEYFITEIEKQTDEPFAISISGRWGSGKTSFINVFKNKKNHNNFIYIEPKIENDMLKMLEDVVVQFDGIFRKEGIYTGKGSALKQYFDTLFRIIGKSEVSIIGDIFSNFVKSEKYGYFDVKEKLNSDLLKLLNKDHEKYNRIYIIVDDLDRSDEQVRLNTFNFIKEIVNLKGCTVIFLIDYLKLQTKNIDSDYLDKFINDRYELAEITLKEIIDYFNFHQIFFSDKFFGDMSDHIKNEGKYLKNNLLNLIVDINKMLDKMIDLQSVSSDKKTDEQVEKDKLSKLIEEREDLSINLRNPRRIKRLYRELERMISIIDFYWFSSKDATTNELSKENWIEIVFRICFIKIFNDKEFDKIIKCGDIEKYIDKSNNFVTNLLPTSISGSTKLKVYNLILFNLYTKNVSTSIKTQNQEIEEQLSANNLNIKNLPNYLDKIMKNPRNNFEYFKQIVKFIIETDDSYENIYLVFSEIEDTTRYNREDIIPYIRYGFETFENRIKKFSSKQISELGYLKKNIVDTFVWGMQSYIIVTLQVANLKEYSYQYIKEKYFKNLHNIDDLCSILKKINEELNIYNIDDSNLKILELENFFMKLKLSLNGKSELKKLGIIISDYFNIIESFIGLIKYILIDSEKSTEGLVKKIELEKSFNWTNSSNLENEAKEAITNLLKYIKSDTVTYEDDVYKYFASLCDVIDSVHNRDTRFLKDYKYINKSLTEIYDTLSEKIIGNAPNFDNWWKYTNIRIQRLKALYD